MSYVMKKLVLVFLVFLMSAASIIPVLADTPYQSYNFNHWGFMVPAPAAYVPQRSFTLRDIDPELGHMNGPTALHVDHEENIYIVDSGNDRIIVIDAELNLNRVIDGFYIGRTRETFYRPSGVFVTESGELFIADTRNHRVVVLDMTQNDSFIREITNPAIDGMDAGVPFLPTNIVVGYGGRTFVIAQHVFEGIMTFNAEGNFIGYFGTIDVIFSPIELFWRFFMTQEQRSRQLLFIPTEFQSMDIDEYGFIFTTNIVRTLDDDQVMRLNPRGRNVINNFNEDVGIDGDQWFRMMGDLSGPSQFIDIAVMSHGMFVALDTTRGRIYTYDSEGNLLHVAGGTGSMQGMTRRPVSIAILGDDYLVLDAHGDGRIVQFTPTEYGALINAAIRARYDGYESDSVVAWRRLTEIDENFHLAWAGIGRYMLAYGDNVRALYYLRRGMDLRHYSVAFRRNRLDNMQYAFSNVMTGAMIFVGVYIAVKITLKFRRKGAAAT